MIFYALKFYSLDKGFTNLFRENCFYYSLVQSDDHAFNPIVSVGSMSDIESEKNQIKLAFCGEKITDEIINYIIYAREKGCFLTGTQDMEVNTLQIVEED